MWPLKENFVTYENTQGFNSQNSRNWKHNFRENISPYLCKKIPMWFFINCTWRIQKQCTYIGIMYIRVNHHLFVYTTTFHVKPQYTNMPVNYLFTQILFTICSLKASENLGILPTDASPYKLIFSLFQEIKL